MTHKAFLKHLTLAQRLERRSAPDARGCILWSGATDSSGYGHLRFKRQLISTHRAAWIAHRGEIPAALLVLHRCDVPNCINPDHLWLGTDADNSKDMDAKGRRGDNRGERHGSAKLTASAIRRIRSDHRSCRAIAPEHGVSLSTVARIRNGLLWRHV